MKKRLFLGTVPNRGYGCDDPITVDVNIDDAGELSITGNIGPYQCGQIYHAFTHEGTTRPYSFSEITPAKDWNELAIIDFFDVWDRWHLNSMRAGCEHQRNEGWDKRPIDPTRPLHHYDRFCGPDKGMMWNMLTWVTQNDHPDGLLARPCPECGYKYGTSWLKEDLPQDIVDYLEGLPSAEEVTK